VGEVIRKCPLNCFGRSPSPPFSPTPTKQQQQTIDSDWSLKKLLVVVTVIGIQQQQTIDSNWSLKKLLVVVILIYIKRIIPLKI